MPEPNALTIIISRKMVSPVSLLVGVEVLALEVKEDMINIVLIAHYSM